MKIFISIIIAVVLSSFFWLSWHYNTTERIRFDRLKAEKEKQEAIDEAYKLRGELADKNRVPKFIRPKYHRLIQKGEARKWSRK